MSWQERQNALTTEKFFNENMMIRSQRKTAFVDPGEKLPTDLEKHLIFQRQLGHKVDIPGSGQWQQLTKPTQKCWICANYTYTLVFWTKAQGWSEEEMIDEKIEDALIRQIEDNNDQFVDDDLETPSYFCEATGWRPRTLHRIEDLFYNIDSHKENTLEVLQKRGGIRESVTELSQLNEKERIKYDEAVATYKKVHYNSSEDIKKIILRDFKYSTMQLINPHLMLEIDKYDYDNNKEYNQVYCFIEFMKPGR